MSDYCVSAGKIRSNRPDTLSRVGYDNRKATKIKRSLVIRQLVLNCYNGQWDQIKRSYAN